MTEVQLAQIDPKTPEEFNAQYIVEAWESRFPDVLTESGRFLLYWFIHDSIKAVLEEE